MKTVWNRDVITNQPCDWTGVGPNPGPPLPGYEISDNVLKHLEPQCAHLQNGKKNIYLAELSYEM